MTRVLIIGGSGMLGHRLWLAASPVHDTFVTVRGPLPNAPWTSLFDPERTITGIEAADPCSIRRVMDTVRPEVVINAAGLIKQRAEAHDPVAAITANALIPHHLAALCQADGARLILISTDCVFSGRRGMYAQDELPDPPDLYGRSKLLGEVTGPGCITLRTSMIGWELTGKLSLVEWFVAQRGRRVSGYTKAIFSGLTTDALAETILQLIENHPDLAGLWQVAGDPIDKYLLLTMINEAMGLGIEVAPDDRVAVDRSLDDRPFRALTGIPKPTWTTMIGQLAADASRYEQMR